MKHDEFVNGLIEMFPDIATRGSCTRAEVTSYMESKGITKWPSLITDPSNRLGRGVYKIGVQSDVVPMSVSQTKDPIVMQPVMKTERQGNTPVVPMRNPDFVPFGIFKDVDTVVKSRMFYPIYIYGPTGNGKSTAVEQSCAKNKVPMIRVNLNALTDEEQLIGSKTLIDGNVEIVEGPVLLAMRQGIPLLLDELDAGSANALLCMQSILEGTPYYFKLKNEWIKPAPGFNVFATGNTKGKGSDDGKYIGTNVLNEAFLERFAATLCQDYPSATTELKIVKNIMATYSVVDDEFAASLVKWADAIRRTYDDGGIDETITTRRLIHIVRAFSIFHDKTKALEICTNRFDEVTRQAFISLFEKVSVDTTQVIETPAEVQPVETEI